MRFHLRNISKWVMTLIFAITVPLRAQALVLCIEADGRANVEFASSAAECQDCPIENENGIGNEEQCECTDVAFDEASSLTKLSKIDNKPDLVFSNKIQRANFTFSSYPSSNHFPQRSLKQRPFTLATSTVLII